MRISTVSEESLWKFEEEMNSKLKNIEKNGNEVVRILYNGFIEEKRNFESGKKYRQRVYEAIIEYEKKKRKTEDWNVEQLDKR